MTADRAEPTFDRADEYINSPLMTQRLVYRKQLSARIEGNYGVYRTTVRIGRKLAANCTCPSDLWPCKHVRAVRATWNENPGSFFDLELLLKDLEAKPKVALVDAIRQVLLAYPESLAVFGVPGFEPDHDGEDDE
jgi:uncharacterized Zn finger protein